MGSLTVNHLQEVPAGLKTGLYLYHWLVVLNRQNTIPCRTHRFESGAHDQSSWYMATLQMRSLPVRSRRAQEAASPSSSERLRLLPARSISCFLRSSLLVRFSFLR